MALLDEYVNLTGYHRSYGSYLLRNYGRKLLLRLKGKKSNFQEPLLKLVEKVKIGSRTRKKYDTPITPFGRVLLSPQIGEDKKERLLNLYEELNPAELKRKMLKLQYRLVKLNQLKETIRRRSLIDNKSKSKSKDFVYIY